MKKILILSLFTLLPLFLVSCGYTEDPILTEKPSLEAENTSFSEEIIFDSSLTTEEMLHIAEENGFVVEKDTETEAYVVVDYIGLETEITIPLVASVIGSEAFLANDRITAIHIHNQVERIMFGAFNECANLEKIYVPDSVVSIVNPFMYSDYVTIFVKENSYADHWINNYNTSLVHQNLQVNALNMEYF